MEDTESRVTSMKSMVEKYIMGKNFHISKVQKLIEQDFTFSCPHKEEDQWLLIFIQRINDMIENEFPKLVAILYRLDVDESKLTLLLKDRPDSNAGQIISELIIERQSQKIRTREAFTKNNPDINENEKW